MLNINKNLDPQKNINKEISLNQKLLNLIKHKIHPPPNGYINENPKKNNNLNFSTLEPILSNGKKILVGDGSFSKVILYQHKISKIKYAVKIMNIQSFVKKTNNRNLILEEVNIQSKITHPNIIRLFNYFTDKNNINIFLILEYASKGTLFDYIHYKKGLDEDEAFYYFIQAVHSIFFLHKNNIIHRDLKPENLLINKNNILKLCDFGWSVYLHNNKRVTFCGTVEYMAPEIVKNEAYDFSIDVWSLGVLLYELIHSHSPFVVKDLNINKIENNIVSKDLIFKKGVSSECRDLIEKLLVKDAENRIKIEEIYKHPFILKYINKMNRYIKDPKNNEQEKYINNKQIINEQFFAKKEEDNQKNKIEKIRGSISEFGTIPTEPEVGKIQVNFDNIVRKFSKINSYINVKKNKNENKEKQMIKQHSINNLINNKTTKETKETKHKKSLSLNGMFLEKSEINDFLKNIINENRNKNMEKQNSEKQTNKNWNLNKENLLKLIIKKNKYDSPKMKHEKFIKKKTLIEEYNENLNKRYYKNEMKIFNKFIDSKLNENSSSSKNILIASYKSKYDKKLFNKKLLENLTEKSINNNKSKLEISSFINIKNSKSISFFNKIKKNKTYNEYISQSNSNSYRKNNTKNFFKIKTKKNKLSNNIKKFSNNKNNNINNNSFFFLKTPNSKGDFRNKFIVNLSNINVYNICSSGVNQLYSKSFNNPKYIDKINTFVIMNKSGELGLKKFETNKDHKNNYQTERKNKKKNVKLFSAMNKSNYAKINKTKANIIDEQKNLRKDHILYLNVSKFNKHDVRKIKLKESNSKKQINN